jgi:predicted TIM-barrel fold metal-dependent hydrolase
MQKEHQSWLDLTIEKPIEPELPICDPHHHLWDRENNRYLLDDLLQDIKGGHNIIQTVFVECRAMYRKDGPYEMRPVGETEFVQGIAEQSTIKQYAKPAVANGIVGFADLTLGSLVMPVLEAHITVGKNRFKGIRHPSAWDASEDIISYGNSPERLLLDSKFREGFACLGKHGLSFDAWLYHTQLTDLADLARAFPDTVMVLNHVGGPLAIGPYAGKRSEVFLEWKKGIAELSTCNNVFVKLGGLGMPLGGFNWNERPVPPDSAELAATMAPYYLWCIEHFGVDRCMFESNFPVDKQSYSYTVMWNSFKKITRDFSTGERNALFCDSAVRVYRLDS